jgi:hypothetical protein
MCTRSVRWVMQLDRWMNSAWRLSFRSIRHAHLPLFPWHVWHHSLTFCLPISPVIILLHYHLTVTCREISNVWAVLQCDLDSRTFTWCVRPLHMRRRIMMSHNLVTESKNTLTHSKIVKQLTFHHDRMSKTTVCISIPPQTPEPSPSLCQNPISIWYLAGGYMQG